MPWYPGKPVNVNDTRNSVSRTVRHKSDLEGLPTGADVVAHEAEQELGEAEAVTDLHLGRRDVREVVKALPYMNARKDRRKRPKRVGKKAFKLFRQLKLKDPKRLKVRKKKRPA